MIGYRSLNRMPVLPEVVLPVIAYRMMDRLSVYY
jgi:hypothetical protein